MEAITPVVKSIVVRCKEFFGLKDGQTLLQFKQEVDALTPEDRQWFCDEFNKIGMPTALRV